MAMVYCRSCAKELHDTAPACIQCGAPQSRVVGATTTEGIPDGVRGWSWGAFLFNWIWAIGNRTWIGLLALVPYVGFGVAIWLGFQGREMAWKNGRWDSLDHFNRVQKAWSQWALGLFCVGLTIILTTAIFGGGGASARAEFQQGSSDGAKASQSEEQPAPKPQPVVQEL
jgi:hypothetical protein